nr:MAG TPA: hypothetical protein [Caudoviricetes sp.]
MRILQGAFLMLIFRRRRSHVRHTFPGASSRR